MTTERIRINGIELNYATYGDASAPPMVLMHGWGCTHKTVESIALAAAETHHVYSVDFPGFGDSQEPPEPWGTEEYTIFIEQMCRELGIMEPVLAGHSFGGRVAITFASRNKVSKVILIDSAGVKPKRTADYYLRVYWFKFKKRILQLALGREKAAQVLDRLRAKAGSADYRNSSPMMRRILSRVVNEDLCHLMPLISAPTLLIWGSDDTATPLSDAQKMERLIPGSGLVNFPGASHYSFLDRPAQFAAVLRSFLNS